MAVVLEYLSGPLPLIGPLGPDRYRIFDFDHS